jgi:hypothetical protein
MVGSSELICFVLDPNSALLLHEFDGFGEFRPMRLGQYQVVAD